MFDGKEFRIRKRAFILFSFIAFFLLAVFGYYNFRFNLRELGIFELTSGVVVLLNLLLFLVRDNYSLASSIYLAAVSVVFITFLLTGGIHGTGIFWVFLYPILTSFLKDIKEAFVWNLIFSLIVVFIVVLGCLGYITLPYDRVCLKHFLIVYFSLLVLSYLYSKFSLELLNRVKTLAVRDPLTGLYNRAFALSYLSQELEKVKRKELPNLCIAYIDLDNFKQVNDTLGHSEGDKVLSEVGAILKKHFRRSDVVARIGGDEFLIVFTNCEPERIRERLEFLRETLEEKFKKYGLSMSYGVAEAPKDALRPSFLIKIADQRMYEDKKRRKMVRKGVKGEVRPRRA
ncbi:GGDEF domain-containing protein [Thermovibrio sp.]